MQIVLVSNYINHHQIPFCLAMRRMEGVEFTFIQTEPMEEERVRMGWQTETHLPFLKLFYEEPELCRKLISESSVVIFGGCDDERYIADRLASGKPVIRYSERLYKEGQWKAVSPRGLLKKYQDHTRYRKAQVYLLCAGAYVPDDFHIIRAYPGKMYRWGYFPEKKEYDLDTLFAGKGYEEKEYKNKECKDRECKDKECKDKGYRDKGCKDKGYIPYLLWAARFIDWKHPELAVYTAKHLKEKGIPFHLDMVGGGEMEAEIKGLTKQLGLEDVVSFPGFCPPEKVREMMERADIYLVTSDRKEGWGAVVNEAMNSGCAVIADHMVGAAPFLIRQGKNGFLYQDGKEGQLYAQAEKLARDRRLCRSIGEEAYRTIAEVWNPENAAACLMQLIRKLGIVPDMELKEKPGQGFETEAGEWPEQGPCTPAPVIREKRMYRYLMERDS